MKAIFNEDSSTSCNNSETITKRNETKHIILLILTGNTGLLCSVQAGEEKDAVTCKPPRYV